MELAGPILPSNFETKIPVRTLVRASRSYSLVTPTTYAYRALKIYLYLSVLPFLTKANKIQSGNVLHLSVKTVTTEDHLMSNNRVRKYFLAVTVLTLKHKKIFRARHA